MSFCCCRRVGSVDCDSCSDRGPAQWSVTLAGISDDLACPEADCDQLNDTFILSSCYLQLGTYVSKCDWGYELSKPGLCATSHGDDQSRPEGFITGVWLRVTLGLPPLHLTHNSIEVNVSFRFTGDVFRGPCFSRGSTLKWGVNFPDPIASTKCAEVSQLSAPFIGQSYIGTCKSDGTAAIVSAL